jgi:hypothetical protein
LAFLSFSFLFAAIIIIDELRRATDMYLERWSVCGCSLSCRQIETRPCRKFSFALQPANRLR